GSRPGGLVAGGVLEKTRLAEEVASPEQCRRAALLRRRSSDLDLAGANRVHLRSDLSLLVDRFSRRVFHDVVREGHLPAAPARRRAAHCTTAPEQESSRRP